MPTKNKLSSFSLEFKISKLLSLLFIFLYVTLRPITPTAHCFDLDLDNPRQLSSDISRYSVLTSRNYYFNTKSKFSILIKNSPKSINYFQPQLLFNPSSLFLQHRIKSWSKNKNPQISLRSMS